MRKRYDFQSLTHWAQELDLCVQDFFNAFRIYPNLLIANSVTFSRMDIAADKEQISDSDGNQPENGEYVKIGGFVGEHYQLDFAVDDAVEDLQFVLLHETEPGGGKPLPKEKKKIA